MTSATVTQIFGDDPDAPASLGDLVALLEGFSLYRVTDDHYILTALQDWFPKSWVEHHFPESGMWWTQAVASMYFWRWDITR